MAEKNIVRENIVRDAATGEVFIPASKRPDGTWRKPIKVREGYIPQEETRKKYLSKRSKRFRYESKGTQLAKQKEKIIKKIPGAVFVDDLEKETKDSKAKQKQTVNTNRQNEINKLNKMMSEIKVSNKITPDQIEADQKQKHVRKLKKQLREIEQIEEKVKSGQQVEKEQLEKVKKKEYFIQELEELGEDINS